MQYEAGKILFQDGDYATALLKFQGAYAKTKEPRLLWNVAVCQKNLRHYARTLDVLRQYLDEGGALLMAEDRQEATDLMKAIEPFTTSLTVNVSEEGAEVFVDDEPLGSSPIAKPIVTDIGSRRFRAKKDGFRVFEKEIPVGGSVGAVVELKLERQGGKLELRVRADATVFLDDKEIGRGPLVQIDSPIGGHALRTTAPKMRTYQGEVVIEDGKTRNLEIVLEPDLEHIAEIRVAVGCTNPEPFTPEQGLTIFLDGSAESASPLGVRKRLVEGTERIAFVPFTVTPGHHSVRVRIPGCESLLVVQQDGVQRERDAAREQDHSRRGLGKRSDAGGSVERLLGLGGHEFVLVPDDGLSQRACIDEPARRQHGIHQRCERHLLVERPDHLSMRGGVQERR